jgi:hypothetical protein
MSLGSQTTSPDPVDVECPDDPKNWSEALTSPDSKAWITGTQEELQSLREHAVLYIALFLTPPFLGGARSFREGLSAVESTTKMVP